MPVELLILIGVFVLIAVLFLFAKRPIYEIMAVAFLFVVVVSGQWAHLWEYLVFPATNNLFYIIFAFLVVAAVFDATDAVNRIIKIMLAVIGKLPGGVPMLKVKQLGEDSQGHFDSSCRRGPWRT